MDDRRTEMRQITATPQAGLHCENCGQASPELDEDGYTDCCNELLCYGDSGRDRWAIETEREGRRELAAVVTSACCGSNAFAAANAAGILWQGAHLDCNSPSCAAHKGARR
jgi:hypothetical protein